ncbi:MAG: PQQ-dependent sugar dehydrogenase [Fibrobacterota bacterium]|nr:PQQ-dependent sugar dehydrogenase [Fibrobacterota bacterium]
MRTSAVIGLAKALVCLAAFQTYSQAQVSWTYPGCPEVTDEDFEYTTLVQRNVAPDPKIAEPDKLAFDMDAEGNVDVYFTELRPGNIKRYSAKTKTVKTLVKLPNWGGGPSNYLTVPNPINSKGGPGQVEEGVTGIALDPNFKTNGWIYIHWSPLPATKAVFRISRFTVTGDTILLDNDKEKVILEFEAQRDECCHTGGSMEFDAYGDLWIAQGANGGRGSNQITTDPQVGINEVNKYQSEEWGATSTAGMRGGFLRIHPDNSLKGYSIPKDNFGEYFFKQTGKPEYMDTSKVLPEIYIKGTRNNYSMALDPVRRWVMWGDVGPDVTDPMKREEFNLRKTPGFEGWPYFTGLNTKISGNKDANTPTNTSKWNKGLTTLPPARPAFFIDTIGRAPISGPLYLYDGDSKSTVKFPPHFHRKWFVTDFQSSRIEVLTLDSAGEKVTKSQPIFKNFSFSGPVDFRSGPDGALYVVNYGSNNFSVTPSTGIVKISYKGTCRPAEPKLEIPVVTGLTREDMAPRKNGMLVNLGAGRLVTVPVGMSGFELYNIDGKSIWRKSLLKAGESFRLPDQLQPEAMKYRWISAQ